MTQATTCRNATAALMAALLWLAAGPVPALAGDPKLSSKNPAFLCLDQQVKQADDVVTTSCSPLDAFTFGLKAVPGGNGSGGAGPPEIETNRLEVTKSFDNRSAKFLEALASGEVLEGLELAISLDDGGVIKFTFAMAVVRELSFEGGTDGVPLREKVVFDLLGVQFSFQPIVGK